MVSPSNLFEIPLTSDLTSSISDFISEDSSSLTLLSFDVTSELITKMMTAQFVPSRATPVPMSENLGGEMKAELQQNISNSCQQHINNKVVRAAVAVQDPEDDVPEPDHHKRVWLKGGADLDSTVLTSTRTGRMVLRLGCFSRWVPSQLTM